MLPNLKVDGRPGNLGRDSLDELWNADELVQIRAAMARGEKPPSCSACWNHEAKGGVSRRLLINPVYRHLGGGLAVEKLADEGAATGYRLERKPDWFVFELGNVCNLKCRSCNPLSSSRVAADRVQTAWLGGPPPAVGKNGTAWFNQIDKLAEMIADAGHEKAMLSLMGGEPFLIENTWLLLDELVARGVAPSLYVGLSTNGQQRSARLDDLAPHFRGFNVSVSIDGYGKLNDYLRHGADWGTLVGNLAWLRAIPNVDVAIVPTLQNTNVLDMPDLLRFADEHDLPLAYNVLTEPARLRPANLPPSVRRIAARRLHAYLDSECKPVNRGVVRAYCEILEEPGDAFDAGLFREFVTFTNDLDADRGERLSDAAPELVALIRAAGEWSHDRRHVAADAVAPAFERADLLRRVDRTVSPDDVIFSVGSAVHPDWYFQSAFDQLAEIDAQLRRHDHPGLAQCRAVADFASHYGRMTRMLRAALPHAAVYACDIDRGAVSFCADHLGALPVVTGWRPDEETLPNELDAIVCVSLLTHTTREHWRSTLRAWSRMLRPGGVAAFTYLSERHVAPWLAGEMEHYGSYPPEMRAAAAESLREGGFGFATLGAVYGDAQHYGIAFATAEVVRQELAAAGLELLPIPAEANRPFAQDLVLARKARASNGHHPEAPVLQHDVALIALYDPRCYAPAQGAGDAAVSTWARLAAADPPRPLPTELGFGDPRVAEVREAQVSLARDHGIDAFCYLYFWGDGGPLWDAPLRDLVATGRPDAPFCLMIAVEDRELVGAAAAARMFDEIAAALGDRRYVRVDERKLIVVRDIDRFEQPRAVAAAWRDAAAARGLGELHLCAAQPASVELPEELGFDSFLERPEPVRDRAEAAASALVRPWPAYRFLRTVECGRDAGDPRAIEVYEHWLHSAVDATRRRGEKLVFVDAWNDWLRGAYLEPDDRDGRAALLGTRRAVRGPASGLVLLRRLRDALGEIDPPVKAALGELERVVTLHEHTRDRLLATVEAAIGRRPAESKALHRVPVPSRQFPASGCRFYLDHIAGVDGAMEQTEPIQLPGDEMRVRGWAQIEGSAPAAVDLFLALESRDGTIDRIFRIAGRVDRPDVAAAFPGYPANCGFETLVNLDGLPAGTYGVAIVQSTADATYRDAAPVTVSRVGASCSKT